MADFKTLMNRANVQLMPQDADDIWMLHEFRNGFVHFTPKSWTIEVAGLPRITHAALRPIEQLMQSGCNTGLRETRSGGSGTASRS
jgi:hypothetical protein